MASDESRLHVLFNRSARGSLEQALALAGSTDIAVAPYDDFSFGPIDSDDAEARDRWVEEMLGYSGWREAFEDSLPVLTASAEARMPPIAWIAPNDPRSIAGFLWWLSHQGDRDCLVLEVPSLSLLHPEELLAYLDKARPLTAERRAEWLAVWTRLQAENAPLRVLSDQGLVSAPIDYFDAELLRHAAPEWQQPIALIAAYMLGEFHDTGRYQAGDLVLIARLADLAEAGALEWRGDLSVMRECSLRLPNSDRD